MKKIVATLLMAGYVFLLTACGNAQSTASSTFVAETTLPTSSPAQAQTQPQKTDALLSTEAPQKETGKNEAPENTEEQPQEEENMTLQMMIGDTPVSVAWEDNDAVETLKDLCREQPLTIAMFMYGGFEQVGAIGADLPRNDVETTTSSGDIVLYSGNQMVVFYGSNTWAYTRLGHITNQDENGMAQLLSNGDTTVTIRVE